ncbi:hypothetical protein F6X40_36470 [Paraburkholderia sp. UCT31]|uniref:SPRY domain-containing protein n=1 Tax=Paraburkholderia sp. UCT31 TaxID=2615209 RepID=UPI0016567CE1|nr:SPRY domain-containing protein [Paraburkholderia sp. UCT31]MBC8742037.1 hypothetical protein [Paraburkholderia sp. UCT31]
MKRNPLVTAVRLPIVLALALAASVAVAGQPYSLRVPFKGLVASGAPAPSSTPTTWGWYNKGTLQSDQLTWNSPNNQVYNEIIANQGHNSGKWYFEVTLDAMSTNNVPEIGVIPVSSQPGGWNRTGDAAIFAYPGGAIVRNNTEYLPVAGASKGTVGVAVDLDKNTVDFYVNCKLQNSPSFSMTGAFNPGTTVYPFTTVFGATTVTANFGQSAFACTPPAGYQTNW